MVYENIPLSIVAFHFIPAVSERFVDVTSYPGKGKHANHKRRFKRTLLILRRDSMRIVHSANIVQPRPGVLSLSRCSRAREEVRFLLAQRAVRTSTSKSSSRALHRFGEIFRETCLCSRRVKWKGGSQKDRVTPEREMG